MLDIFRKHATSWLIKVALFLIVIVFIFWGGYTYKSKQEGQIARVGDYYISLADYNQSYNQLMEMYRRQLGNSFSEDLLRQLNLKQQALDLLVDRYLLSMAGQELGLAATPQEIQQKILEYPVFLADGKFDKKRYELLLRQNHLTTEAFERQISQELTFQKLEAFIKRRALVTEEEIASDFQFNYNRRQLAYALFNAKSFEDKVVMDDKALQAFHQERQESYKEPEKRQLSYVLLKADDYLANVQATDNDILQYYEDHQSSFRHEMEVRASHILFSLKEDAPEEEVTKVKAEAQKVLEEARKGKDFNELVKKYSKDPSAAKNGGDLGYFTRDKMVPAFSDAAFALKPGEISDLVRTPFGFHIIKVQEVRPEKVSTLEEVRGEIEKTLKQQKARDIAYGKAREFTDLAYAQKDIAKAAQAVKLQLTATGVWVSQKDSLPGLAESPPELMNKFFTLTDRETSDPIEVPQGFVVAQVQAVQAPQVLPFDKAKERLEKDFRVEQSRVLAQKAASELLDTARKAKNLEEAAKAMKVEVKKSDWFSRREPDKELKLLQGEGQNKVFQLEEAQPFPEAPLDMGNRYMVCQLLGKKAPEETLEKERASVSARILQQKQGMIWQSWLAEQRSKIKVERYREL